MTATKADRAEELLERLAHQLERQRHPEMTDEEFDHWFNYDPVFTSKTQLWDDETVGTEKEMLLEETKQAILTLVGLGIVDAS